MKPDVQGQTEEDSKTWTMNPWMLQQLSPQQRAALNLPPIPQEACGPGG